ncbi:MAG TPA: hypothetical protein VL486_02595 [Verrucomicrobiae bacterium]|nr:hypothetical protein [Verrucomicrobiae bacterium]
MNGQRVIPFVVVAGLLAYYSSLTSVFVDGHFGSITEKPTERRGRWLK